MLKIKDNVDLDELIKKYDFERYGNRIFPEHSFIQSKFNDSKYNEQLAFRIISRELFEFSDIGLNAADLLYDLIKADLVEKVD